MNEHNPKYYLRFLQEMQGWTAQGSTNDDYLLGYNTGIIKAIEVASRLEGDKIAEARSNNIDSMTVKPPEIKENENDTRN